MAPKLVLLACLFLLSVTPPALAALVGNYRPIRNVSDPEVQKIGKFAISKHNKEAKVNLQFTAVLSGETQVVAGINYRLTISAKNGIYGAIGKYIAVVWKKLNNDLQLISFKSA